MDPRPPVLTREPVLLDLPRQLVEAKLFDSYTYTGVVVMFSFSTCARFKSDYHRYDDISRNFVAFAGIQTL